MTRIRTIAILLFPGVNALDVAGPVEAFSTVRRDDGASLYRPTTIALGTEAVRAESGLRLCVDLDATECDGADLLIIPGGAGVREPDTLPRLGEWLRVHHQRFGRIASVCTGAYVLAQSGLVDGRGLTTHWAHAADLRRRYPDVAISAESLFLKDGRFYSSGGVTAGIDLALDLIHADHGARAAMEAARQLVVFLRRTGSQAQFSDPLKFQASAVGALAEACHWAAGNLGAGLSVEALAERANLSVRQFTRRFSREFGTPPATFIRNLRLDAARAALVEHGGGFERIAHANGFRSVDGFRRAFERRFGLCPTDYRQRFRYTGDRP
jgi:transcriptional regulator GlxA family with amidase domain